jgi:hypothetical protein
MSTVNRTANPYEIGVAYVDGKPLGKVIRSDFVEEPDYTGPSRAIMERLFEEDRLTLSALSYCEGGYEITRSYDHERNLVAITIAPCSRWHP